MKLRTRFQNSPTSRNDSPDRVAKYAGVATPIVVGLIGAVIAILGHNIQQSIATVNIRMQREQSDTKIRSELFKSIADKLMEKSKENQGSASQDAVLAEMLALNFHEQIELKPLMLDVDQRLSEEISTIRKSKDYEKEKSLQNRREELRSIARRVKTRQLSILTSTWLNREDKSYGNHNMDSDVHTIFKNNDELNEKIKPLNSTEDLQYITFYSSDASNECETSARISRNSNDNIDNANDEAQTVKFHQLNELVIYMNHKRNKTIAVTLYKADWERQVFSFRLKVRKIQPARVKNVIAREKLRDDQAVTEGDFDLTWYDFPLTDNTLLADGTRFSLFLDSATKENSVSKRELKSSNNMDLNSCSGEEGAINLVTIGILYFPDGFIPSRERPENYKRIRDEFDA